MKYDLILRNGNIYGGGMLLQKNMDIAVKDGMIAKVDKHVEGSADAVIDISGKMVSPGFIDSHMHIDKALLMEDDGTKTLVSAIDRSIAVINERFKGKSEDEIYADIMERSSEILKMCISHGTTAVKTHVMIGGVYKMLALDAMTALKKRYKDQIDIYTVVPYVKEMDTEWREAAKKGQIDFIGGCPNLEFGGDVDHAYENSDAKPYIDLVFELAKTYDLPIDLHTDESDRPNIDAFLYIIEKTKENRMQGRVTASHVTALDAPGIDPVEAAVAVARCAKAKVHVTSMTSCNLYLMDWGRRGPTKVRELMDAGVSVAIASDNIQDAFRPYGNANLMEEALLTAQVHKYTTHAEFSRLFEMITYNPAENILAENYGTLVGCAADLVVVDAPDVTEAILSKAKASFVLKCGRLVAKDGMVLEEVKL